MRLRRVLATIPRDFKKLPRSIKWMALIIGIYSLSWGSITPFLPIYLNEIVGTYTGTTFIIAVFFLFSAFWSIFMGRLADIFSKKSLISLFLLLYLPIGPFFAVLKTVFQFTLLRLYHSFTAAGLWGASEVYIRSHSPKHQRAESMGLFDSSHSLFIVLGALIGGVVITFADISLLFYGIPIIFIGTFFVTIFFLPDHHGSHNLRDILPILRPRIFIENIRDFLKNKALCRLSVLSFLFAFPLFAVQEVLLPLFSETLGAGPIQIGIVFALAVLPFFFEAPLSVLSDHISNRKIILSSGLSAALLLTLLFFTQSLMWVFILSFLVGLSFALILPTLDGNATALMPRSNLGEFNGVYRAIYIFGAGVGILVMGPLADAFGINAPFLLSAGVMVLFSLAGFVWWGKIEDGA